MNQLPNHLNIHRAGELPELESVPLAWYSEHPNWGDKLNPVLVRLLAGKPARKVEVGSGECFIVVGSVLWMADAQTEVWGSGFMYEEDSLVAAPKRIHAVRGPLTRAALIRQGIDCPAVYGDPALLLPSFYDPEVAKQYEIGLIPHILDKEHPWIRQQAQVPGTRIIDVQGDLWEFVAAVKSCRRILSSSLHGLVCADAYGVPNAWLKLSGELPGGDFKFRDYRLSLGAGEPQAVWAGVDTPLAEAAAGAELHRVGVDLRQLLLACPFLSSELREKVLSAAREGTGWPRGAFASGNPPLPGAA